MYCALKNSSLRTDKRIRDEETLLIPDEKFSAKLTFHQMNFCRYSFARFFRHFWLAKTQREYCVQKKET